MTLSDFLLIIIITVTIWDWCESTNRWTVFFLETIGQIKPLIWGKMCTYKCFFGFHSVSVGFLEEKISKLYLVPLFSIEKVIFIFVVWHPIPWKNGHAPQKLFFAVLLEDIVFFKKKKNYYIKNIQNLNSYKKVYIDFCCQTPSSSQNCHVLLQIVFRNFFNLNWRTSASFSCSKVYSFKKKEFYGV